MSDKNKVRSHWIHLRLSSEEFEQVKKNQKETTCRTRSEYLRKILLNKPVNIRVRNQSADEFLAVALQLKKELNAVGNNYNQAVHKLHILDDAVDVKQWLVTTGSLHKTLVKKVSEIGVSMDKIYQLWLQK
jgi:hypothetical protein